MPLPLPLPCRRGLPSSKNGALSQALIRSSKARTLEILAVADRKMNSIALLNCIPNRGLRRANGEKLQDRQQQFTNALTAKILKQ